MINKSSHTILFVAAEVAPFASVGGLSQVMYFLPKTLKKLGYDVAVFMPKYGTIDEKKYAIKMYLPNLEIPTGEVSGITKVVCNVKMREGTKTEPTVFFLENNEYFEQRANVYGYSDDHTRFALFSRGVIEFIKKTSWIPQIIHANDWHTAYLVNYLRKNYLDDKKLQSIATVLTIHNLAHQGNGYFHYVTPMEFDDGKSPLESFFSPQLKKQNALKRGIIYSDIVNTVSERYSREIMTPEYGQGLSELLKEVRGKVYGVLNGLDYTDFNPATDAFIKRNYSLSSIANRIEDKLDLQKEFNLPVNADIPILALSGRLDDQKGIDLVLKILPYMVKEFDMQLIVMGDGDHKYKESFMNLEQKYPKQIATHLMANWQLPRKIFSGADIFLLPSKFEPGGIVVIEALRYGAIPVVRATGGLADTVIDFDISTEKGNGFVFYEYSELSLFGCLTRALEMYKAKKIWQKLVRQAMLADFSWEASAKKYSDLYNRAMDFRRVSLSENPGRAFR